ncbi:ubiquitin carboxyl-terminal hydrolase [Colletotrichum navitas]|uniref:Ubiquitin carboxyl-terminal hydrolase n=1 Tax=Colletotrichum navitas TaxID=681940 RepID=A0AAD8PTT8_9PEZI|nr:ubiquitin carboxyl-terminal hydrolase [Colletotrichum navitas]KAK1580600.1 ubiquitin carboxyl-terminal hydrolase [Colletotrichum navitas]
MACPHLESIASALQPPAPSNSVYREDCTQCFDSIDDPAGLDVCLQCFNGGCAGDRKHAQLHRRLWNHPLVLNIRRTRKLVVRDEPPLKMSKLAIAVETEADRYDTKTVVKCLDCDQELDHSTEKLAPIVDGILKANTFSRKEEVKAWEQELTSCEHILLMQQAESRTIQSGDLGHCSACDLHENLWLCLDCGNLGCGRKQMGGVDGNSHALAHSQQSGHGVAVKLGSITPEGTADVYCYKCDEERIDDDLGKHLAHWGINLANQQKTEKSLTEMQIEQNLRWDFSMTTEDGKELKPLFGPGLTGLKNLGNSCYLASIVQCLFDTPAFKNRYYLPDRDLPNVQEPAADLETQLRKMADGLLSGRYSKADSDVVASEHSPEIAHQKGLAPAMLKHLIGRGHAEFSTMRQQDAFELLQHIFKLVSRSQHPWDLGDPTSPFRFTLEQRLQCLGCKKVRYSTNEQDNIFIDVPLEKEPVTEGAETQGDAYKAVTLKECLDNFTAEEVVELTCSSCGSKDGYTKRSLFKTLPENLVVNARKMAVINWVPVKIDVPVIVPDEPFLLDDYLSKGLQASEETLPDEPESSAPAFVANAEAVSQLEAMGFGRNRCDRALHATGNSDANAAMEWLFAHMEDPDIDEPLVLGSGGAAAGGGGSADPEKIEMLGAMGFSVPQAKKALRETSGDVERAVEWLFSHPEDQGIFDDDDAAPAAGSESAAAPKSEAGSAATPAKYQLQSIACHKGTSIHAGHYVAFIRKEIDGRPQWVLFNDEKVVEAGEIEEMRKFAYVYFFKRV